MLHEFITEHRDAIIERARVRVASRRVPVASDTELVSGVPLFLSQLVSILREQQSDPADPLLPTTDTRVTELFGEAADQVGDDTLRRGLTVAQVVEGYGDVCQAITEEAIEHDAQIVADEYRTLNLSVDVATARAVSAFSRGRDRSNDKKGAERLGMLAHELRNRLSTAVLSFEALRRGSVSVNGSTAAVLGRSLQAIQRLVDRALGEVRMAAALHDQQQILLAPFIEEIEVGAALDARERGLELMIPAVDGGLAVDADRQLLTSAVANLVQNAMKFTRAGGRVTVTTTRNDTHALIAVEDECGGLPETHGEDPEPFERRGKDRSGLGLGLKISRDAVKADGGEIRVRNLPGKGCVFTIELPVAQGV